MSGCKDLEIRPTAKILPNGLIKYFDSLGNYQRLGFQFRNCRNILLNDGYNVIQ